MIPSELLKLPMHSSQTYSNSKSKVVVYKSPYIYHPTVSAGRKSKAMTRQGSAKDHPQHLIRESLPPALWSPHCFPGYGCAYWLRCGSQTPQNIRS